jgi:hypothetical protein
MIFILICVLVIPVSNAQSMSDQVEISVNTSAIHINSSIYRNSKLDLNLINRSARDVCFYYNFKDLIVGSFFDHDVLCQSDSLFSRLILILKDSLGNLVVPRIPSHSLKHRNKFKKYSNNPYDYYRKNKFILPKNEERKFRIIVDFEDAFNLYLGRYEFVVLFYAGPRLKNIIQEPGIENIFQGCMTTDVVKLIVY